MITLRELGRGAAYFCAPPRPERVYALNRSSRPPRPLLARPRRVPSWTMMSGGSGTSGWALPANSRVMCRTSPVRCGSPCTCKILITSQGNKTSVQSESAPGSVQRSAQTDRRPGSDELLFSSFAWVSGSDTLRIGTSSVLTIPPWPKYRASSV